MKEKNRIIKNGWPHRPTIHHISLYPNMSSPLTFLQNKYISQGKQSLKKGAIFHMQKLESPDYLCIIYKSIHFPENLNDQMFSVGEGGEVARELICSRASSRADRAYKADIFF